MYCRNCGNEVDEKTIFCPNCGASLESSMNSSNSGSDEKTVAIIAYMPVAILNFVIALVIHNNNKSKFGAYHLRQSLGLNILFFITYFLLYLFFFSNPLSFLKYNWLFALYALGILTLFVIGIINASKHEEKPIPFVGNLFEKWFGHLFYQNNDIVNNSSNADIPSTTSNIGSSFDTSNFNFQEFIRTKTFKYILAGFVLILIFWIYSSWASHLRESTVEDLITKKFELPKEITKDVQVGIIDFSWGSRALNNIQELAKKGLFTCSKQTGYNTDFVYEVAITKKGESYLTHRTSDAQGREYCVVKIAEVLFGEVTEIEEDDRGKNAVAKYTLEYETTPMYNDFDELGNGYISKLENNIDELTGQYEENFYKTDEGWKIGKGSLLNRVIDETAESFKNLFNR